MDSKKLIEFTTQALTSSATEIKTGDKEEKDKDEVVKANNLSGSSVFDRAPEDKE